MENSIALVMKIRITVDMNLASFLKDVGSRSFLIPIMNPSKNPYTVEENIANRDTLYWVSSRRKKRRVITA